MFKTLSMKKLRYYFLILNYLQANNCPSREELLRYLTGYDIEISERTFYRALRELQAEYGIVVSFNTLVGGYFIENESLIRAKIVLSCLKNLITSDILMTGKKVKWDLINYVAIENTENTVPIDSLKFILSAIVKKKKIQFKYLNSEKEVHKTFTVAPLFFKQYNDNWYLIGKDDIVLSSFLLDAISDLKVSRDSFMENIDKAKKVYDEILGLSHHESKLQEVELTFDKNHEFSLQSTPIHHSQELSYCEEEDVLLVKLIIRPNSELKQQLLKFGAAVEVVKPKWLRDEMIHEFEYALSCYGR